MTNKWTSVTPLPQPLDHTATAAAFDEKLYVVGGGGILIGAICQTNSSSTTLTLTIGQKALTFLALVAL